MSPLRRIPTISLGIQSLPSNRPRALSAVPTPASVPPDPLPPSQNCASHPGRAQSSKVNTVITTLQGSPYVPGSRHRAWETEGIGWGQSLAVVAGKPGDPASLSRKTAQAHLCVLSCPVPLLSIGAWGMAGKLCLVGTSLLARGHPESLMLRPSG